jgi:tRNA-uridine 2-sulfurtransferase
VEEAHAPSRILVAMSGGVDSAVAAGLLLEAGHDLVGVTLHLWDAEGSQQVGRCCAPEDREDARRVCDHLGIPHYVIDERAAFRQHVVDPFVADYANGRTPAPCAHCNGTVKLGHLTALADQLGATHVATGHYARMVRGADGRPRLLRGRDAKKDQSYFLFGVPQHALARLILPLGDHVKDETRQEARRLGLPNADKPDSQELCFVPDGDVKTFVAREGAPSTPGVVRDAAGPVVGHHDGIAGFTVGQRRGLGLGGGPPRYVLRIVPDTHEVVVGEREALLTETLRATGARWHGPPPETGSLADVRIRHRHAPAPGRVYPLGTDGFRIEFTEPQRAVTPGQAAVVYRGDEVLGGGFIT